MPKKSSFFQFRFVVFFVLTNLCFQNTNAQNTFTGAFDNDWHKSCNWSGGIVPLCSQDVIIPNTKIVEVTAIAHCKTIALQGNADINILGSGKLEVSSSGTTCIGIKTDNSSACGPNCGSQSFASSNLNVGTRINGSVAQSNNGTNEKYCYNDIEANCTSYGALYLWAEAMNYAASLNCDPCGTGGRQGLCPSGYHIPTDLEMSRYEWCVENNIAPTGSTTLATFQTTAGYRGSSVAGVGSADKMKAPASNTPAWNGTNTSNFTALPAGYRHFAGTFSELGNAAFYWTATQVDATYSWYRLIVTGQVRNARFQEFKTVGMSVRCLKN